MTCRILQLLLILLIAHSTGEAQIKQSSPIIQYTYQNWNNKNGLIQNSVADIVKDDQGYLWLATEEGILRFDGTNFKVINEGNTPHLYSSTFYDLTTSEKGIWAASLNTVLYINDESIESFDFRNYIKNSWISGISEDENGMLWIGTNHGELFYIRNKRIEKYSGWPIKKARSIQVLSKSPNGLLIGTELGLFQLNKNKEVAAVQGFQTQNIRALKVDKDGSLWIGTKDNGLYHLSGKKSINYTRKDGLKDLFIRSLGISPTGNVWIGTSSSGLQIFRDGKFEDVTDNGISNDGIKSIFFTEPDLIWLGTPASGLIQMKPARIQRISKLDGLADNIILPIYQHRNGEIWIGTAGQGVNQIKDGKIVHFTRRNGLASDVIISLFGINDKMLIGTTSGLNIFNLKTSKFEKSYIMADGLASNVIQSVFEDSRSRIWISTPSGGLHILENGKIRRLKLPAEMANAELTRIFEDHKNNIWVGSTGAGVIVVNPKNDVRTYKNNLGITSDIVYDFYEDKQGDLWLGTEAGLISFQKKAIYNKSNGLSFNGIYRIIEDGAGYLWLSGNFGLQRISTSDLLRENRNQTKGTLSSHLFNTLDGMANSETNGNISPAGWKMNDGSLWFPSVEGIAVVKTSQHETSVNIGPVKINSIQYENQIQTQLENITIPPNVYNVSINYTNINFSDPQKTIYHYRLRGLTDTWVNAGNRLTAYFSLLEPGDYIFEVKAERSGIWSEVSSFSFSVAPVFYQTNGFRAAAVLLLLLIGFSAHKLYSNTQQQKLLKKLVAERTKELQASNKEFEIINQQLHTSREQYQSLFLHNPYAVFSMDLKGNFINVNQVTSTLSGYAVEELLNMSFIPLIAKSASRGVLKKIIKAGRGQTQNYQTEIETAKGNSLYVDVTNIPMVVDGKISGIYGIVKDITSEKFLADQLVLANQSLESNAIELKRSNDELEQFAFVASHDLQEPLRMITSFMAQLKNKYGESLDQKAHQYIHFATEGAQRMRQIILDLLEYSRADKPAIEKELVDTNELVSECEQSRRKLILEKSATIKTGRLPIIDTYKAAITQILHCLIDNALHYTRPDLPPIIELDVIDKAEEWQFSIKDNGIGIDPQFYDKIFVIFQRLHSRSEYAGTGLGLSIAKRQIEHLGGRIWVDSVLGEGSIFYFTIPKNIAEQ